MKLLNAFTNKPDKLSFSLSIVIADKETRFFPRHFVLNKHLYNYLDMIITT